MEVRKIQASERPSSARPSSAARTSLASSGRDQLSKHVRPSSARLPVKARSRPASASASKNATESRTARNLRLDDDGDDLNDSNCQILEDISEPSSPNAVWERPSSPQYIGPPHVQFDSSVAKSLEGEFLSSFGMFQGKKFSLRTNSDVARPQSAQSRMTGGLYEKDRSKLSATMHSNFSNKSLTPHHVLFRDKKDRSKIIQAIHAQNMKTAMHIMSSSLEGTLTAFVPRLRPRPMSAGARLTSEQRPSNREAHGSSVLHSGLLTALNLPSQGDDELDLRECMPDMPPGLDGGEMGGVGDGGLWCDEGFGADERRLVGRVMQSGEAAEVDLRGAVTAWCRPEELVPAGCQPAVFDQPFKATPGSVVQGGLGDCHLLGALSVLATRPDLVQNLFGGPARTEPAWAQGESAVAADLRRGLATVRLYKDGAWRDVTVDTRLPARAGRHGAGLEPAFGACADRRLFWVSLVEKA